MFNDQKLNGLFGFAIRPVDVSADFMDYRHCQLIETLLEKHLKLPEGSPISDFIINALDELSNDSPASWQSLDILGSQWNNKREARLRLVVREAKETGLRLRHELEPAATTMLKAYMPELSGAIAFRSMNNDSILQKFRKARWNTDLCLYLDDISASNILLANYNSEIESLGEQITQWDEWTNTQEYVDFSKAYQYCRSVHQRIINRAQKVFNYV